MEINIYDISISIEEKKRSCMKKEKLFYTALAKYSLNSNKWNSLHISEYSLIIST